jgi:hypothetical protein
MQNKSNIKKVFYIVLSFFAFVSLYEVFFYFESLYKKNLFEKGSSFECVINNKTIIFSKENNSSLEEVSYYVYLRKDNDFSKIYKCSEIKK